MTSSTRQPIKQGPFECRTRSIRSSRRTSIALIGASRDQEKIPGRLLSMLRKNEFPGKLYPINPNYGDIDGLKCYPSIAAVGQTNRSCHRHHSGARGSRRAQGMRRRRCQECGDHLVGIRRGGRRQRRHAGGDRRSRPHHRHADFRSQCGRILQRSPACRRHFQPDRRRQAGCAAAGRDHTADRHRCPERRHRLCDLSPRQSTRHRAQLCRQRRQRIRPRRRRIPRLHGAGCLDRRDPAVHRGHSRCREVSRRRPACRRNRQARHRDKSRPLRRGRARGGIAYREHGRLVRGL